MITPRSQANVMDFGLAKVVASAVESEAETMSVLTMPGVILGTIPYMSPEQVKGEQVDARTDIFSFGVVLYEAISGQQPFAGASAAATALSGLKAGAFEIAAVYVALGEVDAD